MTNEQSNEPKLTNRPVILIVEDDEYCANAYQIEADKLGWEVLKARHVDQAKELASQHKGRIRLALVDLMLPANEAALREVESCLKEEEAIERVALSGAQPLKIAEAQLKDAYKAFGEINKKMRIYIILDHGIRFLKEAAANQWLIGTHVVVCSARDTTKADVENALLELPSLFPSLTILQKPVRTKVLRDILNDNKL